MEKPGTHHFNQGFKVKITSSNPYWHYVHPDVMHWEGYNIASLINLIMIKPQTNPNREAAYKILYGLEPRAHILSSLVRKGMKTTGGGHCWLVRHIPYCLSSLQCAPWLECIILCPRAFSKAWRWFCLCWPETRTLSHHLQAALYQRLMGVGIETPQLPFPWGVGGGWG